MRLSEKQKEVLKTIGICVILAGAIMAPNIIQILKPLTHKKKYQYKRVIKKLHDEKAIILSGEVIKLTKKGEDLVKLIQMDEITIAHPDSWNSVWHLVCYDIPENKKKERDYFRKKLINLGFCVIQDSLWVFPYECKEEIAIIAQSLGISPFVAYLNTNYLPQQNKLIRYFRLNNLQDQDE